MSRILLSFPGIEIEKATTAVVCMYGGLIKAMKKDGHDVVVINSSRFLRKAWAGSNQAFPWLHERKLAADIKLFSPEVAFIFNHSVPNPAFEILDCPMVLWGADSSQFYNDQNVIKKNIGRYHFFCFSLHGIQNAHKFGALQNKVF